jgi:hypothetical protein
MDDRKRQKTVKCSLPPSAPPPPPPAAAAAAAAEAAAMWTRIRVWYRTTPIRIFTRAAVVLEFPAVGYDETGFKPKDYEDADMAGKKLSRILCGIYGSRSIEVSLRPDTADDVQAVAAECVEDEEEDVPFSHEIEIPFWCYHHRTD